VGRREAVAMVITCPGLNAGNAPLTLDGPLPARDDAEWLAGEGLYRLRARRLSLPARGGVQLAIALEFINVVVRKSAIEAKFPGGIDGLVRRNLPNFLEDDHLVTVRFMNPQDTSRFLDELEAAGLCYSRGDDPDIAVVTTKDESSWPWLVLGVHEGRTACWLSGQSRGELVDFVPGMVLRCSRTVYQSIGDVVRQCGAEVRWIASQGNEPCDAILSCVRADAEITIYVYGDSRSDSPVGLVGRRDFARRAYYKEDTALIRDLVSELVRSGADGGPSANAP
jgi:hypothetical protein